jgi:hypothetical protein
MQDKVDELLDGKNSTIIESIDYTQTIYQQISTVQRAILTGSKWIYGSSVLMLLSLIPEQDYDEQFKAELNNCTYVTERGTGRYMQGVTHERRTEITIDVTEYDYVMMFKAVINLLRRKGVLWREKGIEVIR